VPKAHTLVVDRRAGAVDDGSTKSEESPNVGRPVQVPPRSWRGPALLLSGVAVLALILASESLEASAIFDLSVRFPGIDKVAHVAQYAAVFLLVWWLLGRTARRLQWRAPAAAAIALALGTGDELFQRVIGFRSFEIADLVANGFGVLLGVGLGPILPSRRVARGLVAVAAIGAAALAAHSYTGLRHFNRGLQYTRQGDLPKALAEYRLALRDGLDSPSFYNELAWTEVESGVGDVQAAVVYASRALAANPDSPDVLDTYGWALHQVGRSREALPLLERAFAGKPRMFCIHYHRGEVYAALGDAERAERHLREQVRLLPGGREARAAELSLRRRGLIVTTAPQRSSAAGS
jgi:tetratricopeptide (TPR) repeat protein